MVGRIIVGQIATLAGAAGLGAVEAIAIDAGVVVAAGRLADVSPLASPRTEWWRPPRGTCVVIAGTPPGQYSRRKVRSDNKKSRIRLIIY